MLRIPDAPKSIQKGVPLKNVLGLEAVDCLANNIAYVYSEFRADKFRKYALDNLGSMEFMERGTHIARALRSNLPEKYEKAVEVILASLTPPNTATEGLGLAVLFYQPHSCFISAYGLDKEYNGGDDPFDISMKAQYELTKRNTSEFSIRPFLMKYQGRTLSRLKEWVSDPDPHVRRLCSEGTRPRLPWATLIPSFVDDPSPILPILESLKNDQSMYVRRSVANSLGDIAKDHPDFVLELCESWISIASKEVKWVIRHALRLPAKKGDKLALQLRAKAK
ncbi:MAG: HEAT repeat protein [Candidatus Scalindua rubra]|uniref:HEAT repeat protein n=1 Tax=Candidatus Scalindua rubra TaxID=1872076 RepID=A0A1E3X337_9BACT|nr:MAG: HEAT repeat protein [Candidatus Scalindua rubra]